MKPWAEFHVIGSAAKLTVKRLSGGDSAAIVAVAHKTSKEWVFLAACWPLPNGGKETQSLNV